MADMLKTIPPLFGLPRASSGWSQPAPKSAKSVTTAPERGPGADFAELPQRGLEDARGQLKRALANGGRRLLLRHFLTELSKVLDEQDSVLAVLDSSLSSGLPLLNRQFYAIRTAAEGLRLQNLVQVAGRAEVLVNLIDSGAIDYEPNHGTVIRETHRLLRKLVAKVRETDSDTTCYSITQTVWSMHAALNPCLCDYEPGHHAEHSVAQSTNDPNHD